MLAAGADALRALWLVPALMGLHLFQLLLSSRAWACLLPPGPVRGLFRLRVVREGIDSLLPVAQVGGEVVGTHLLARHGPALPDAAASVVVDVTVEVLTQLLFLLAGVATLALISPGGRWEGWLGAALMLATIGAGLLVIQRFGLLRLVESLARQIAARWPQSGVQAGALEGLHGSAAAIYARRGKLLRAATLHGIAWLLGSVESWAVLHALGTGAGAAQALVVEALGMAARSAGFAIPGALLVQETGFVLAAAAAGLPGDAGLALSLVKRVREVLVTPDPVPMKAWPFASTATTSLIAPPAA